MNRFISLASRLSLIFAFMGVFFLVIPNSVSAATYYVDPSSGNDANNGTSTGTAWKTIEKALENGGIAQGDTLYLMEGTHNTFKSGTDNSILSSIGAGNGSGVITISANPGDEGSVIVSMPASTSTTLAYFYLNNSGITINWNNLIFFNDNAGTPVAADWFRVRNGKLNFTNCLFDNSNQNTKTFFVYAVGSAGEVNILRSTFQNLRSYIFQESSYDGAVFRMKASVIKNGNATLFNVGSGTTNTTLEFINNTLYSVSTGTSPAFVMTGTLSSAKFINNVFYFPTYSSTIFNSNSTFEQWAHNNNGTNLVFTNNIIWKANPESMAATYWDTLVFSASGAYSVVVDKSNRFLDPGFVNAPTDVSISASSHILGQGDNSQLPSGGDINGNAWTGYDIGAYAMPSLVQYTYTLNSNKVAFLGDSIFGCAGTSFGVDGNCIYRKFASLTGLETAESYVGNATYLSAISGGRVEDAPFLADWVIEHNLPKVVFVSMGINNVYGTDSTSDNHPTNVTYQEIADIAAVTMDKLDDYGVIPIWMGVTSLLNGGTNEPDAINSAMEIHCVNNDWICGSSLDQMRLNPNWQIDYYDDNGNGLATNLHPDKDGHELMANLAQTLYVEATTPPIISSLNSTPLSQVSTITWETNNNASTKIDYGLTNSYVNSTSETDTSPRVKTHEVSLSGLVSCATYHYRVRSTDIRGNEKIDSDNSFTTSGCTGSAGVTSQTSSQVTTASGGTVSLLSDSKGISITIPNAFSGSDANFQIKQLDATSVTSTTSTPTGYSLISSYLYDLKALSDVSTALSSFDSAITVTMQYGTSDVTSISESSMKIFRWDGSSWNELSGCSVNTSSKTVTCTTIAFSVFGLFGQQNSVSTSSNNNSHSSSSSISTPSCTSKSPVGQPDLFQIDRTGNTAKLYFTPVNDHVESYHVIFGYKDGDERFGGINMQAQNENQGVQSIVVDHLDPKASYSFKVVSVNGCAPGEWSNWLAVGRLQARTSIFYRYWDQVRNLFK